MVYAHEDAGCHRMARAFDPTPDRLRELAAAANGQARVIRLAELGGMNWNPIEGAADWQLAEGLDDESSREGPPELWTVYDKRLRKSARRWKATTAAASPRVRSAARQHPRANRDCRCGR
jgi:hypothetical protein